MKKIGIPVTIAQQLTAFIFWLLVSSASLAVELYTDFPKSINPAENYVFYSHGYIVEGDNPRPVSPQYGVYDFPAIKRVLFEMGGFNLVAEHRPVGTDVSAYVNKLVSWVHTLLDAGVPPTHITLLGFSRGAQLTALASGRLNASGINTVIMAVCSDGDFRADPPLVLGGNVLSIYETTDTVQSCDKLLKRSAATATTREIAITTGKKHGAFYTPQPAWTEPLARWLHLANQ